MLQIQAYFFNSLASYILFLLSITLYFVLCKWTVFYQ
jgi:hypothetical protein